MMDDYDPSQDSYHLIHWNGSRSLRRYVFSDFRRCVDEVNKNVVQYGAKSYQFIIIKGHEMELEIESVTYKGNE